ncbi:MAG: prolyl oligopeptidase family serine peptidase [Verrucomicrobiales bacterium]|nr:prolyl oligopeptidase family serine peptidase [Verrucomicrobiales bacterium]
MRFLTLAFLFMLSTPAFAQVKGYPAGVKAVTYLSAADNTEQPALFEVPAETNGPLPLLVALHTWSNDYKQAGGEAVYARWCQQMGWAFIHPNFRGKNNTPEALGSDLVVEDILSAVEFAKTQANIDVDRIYCIGVSGGGHASLLMAARAPELWAGVSAWCGISDIAKWHQQCTDNRSFSAYARHIESALGGTPQSSPKRSASARHRSPVTWLPAAGKVNLDINHGVNDGRSSRKEDNFFGGSVPFTHSLEAWNAVVPAPNRFSDAQMKTWFKTQQFPDHEVAEDPLYGINQPVFRKVNGPTRITIFDGGHEIIHEAALNWLNSQRLGQPAVWKIDNPIMFETEKGESESGK